MGQHLRGKLGPAGRVELVRLMVEGGVSERVAAATLSVAPATAHRWKQRWLMAGESDRSSGGWARDRSSRPHTSPAKTSTTVEELVLADRARTGHGPRLIAGRTGVAHSTVWAILKRHGCSRVGSERTESVRYEWPCPGDLVHVDVKRYPRFRRPGHAVTGDRSRTGWDQRHLMGYECFHAMVDDHSRLVFGELLADEKAATVTGFFQRALAHFAARGIQIRRVMTDGAWSYSHNRSLRALLTEHAIHHIVTPPYTPRWNGKVERFHQTMEREWAKGLRYRTSQARNQALPHWLSYYNERRPHSALNGQPPISRAHNLPEQDN